MMMTAVWRAVREAVRSVPRSTWLTAAALFLVAAALRVALLPTARFGGDEALFFSIGMDIVEGRAFPALGTQITDGRAMLPGPAFLYLMALPLVVARAPEAQYLFTELLGAATTVLLWHALRRPFGERGALFAGVLFALSPWAALYADRTWNPNAMPFFVVLALLAAIRVREDASSTWSVVLWPAAAVLAHFHMSAPVAWIGLFVVAGRAALRPTRRHAVLAAVAVVLLYTPLLVHELTTGFANTRAMFDETIGNKAGAGDPHPWGFVWVPVYALRLLTLDVTYHELTGYWGGPDELACLKAAVLGSTPRPFSVLRVGALACSLALVGIGVVVAGRRAWAEWRERRRAPVFLLAFVAALVANTALMGVAKKQVFGHYVTNLMPFGFALFAALGEASLSTSTSPSMRTKALRTAVLALALVFCVGGVEATLSISRRVDGRIGLVVHRRTLEHIRADMPAEDSAAGAPDVVRLDFAYRSNPWDWSIFARRAMGYQLRFDRASTSVRAYRLVERRADGTPPPPTVLGPPVDVGYAWLLRTR